MSETKSSTMQSTRQTRFFCVSLFETIFYTLKKKKEFFYLSPLPFPRLSSDVSFWPSAGLHTPHETRAPDTSDDVRRLSRFIFAFFAFSHAKIEPADGGRTERDSESEISSMSETMCCVRSTYRREGLIVINCSAAFLYLRCLLSPSIYCRKWEKILREKYNNFFIFSSFYFWQHTQCVRAKTKNC